MKFWWNFGLQISQIFLKKKTIVLQNSLIKYPIHTIKQHKNFKNFLATIDRYNRKKYIKNTKKSKKQIVKDGILKMFCISNISIFLIKIQ